MPAGRPRSSSGRVITISLTIKPDLLDRVNAECKQLRRTRASLVEEALEAYLQCAVSFEPVEKFSTLAAKLAPTMGPASEPLDVDV